MADETSKSKKKVAENERKLEVYPPIYKLGPAGKWLRAQLMKGILGGSPVLLGMQRLRSPLLNHLMTCVSFLGEEEFYTLLVPVLCWVWEARLASLLALLMALAFYCAGFLKNTLCLPRPPVPPVEPLHCCQDWSLPSHHALMAVNIPWYLWFYLQLQQPPSLSGQASAVLFLCVSLWCFLIMFSRMYLGVHSPADILTGGIVGCLLLAVWLQVDLLVNEFLCTSGGGGLLLVLTVVMVMLYLHPDPAPTTIIYDETLAMVGVAVGVIISQTVGSSCTTTALLQHGVPGPLWWCVTCAVLRCCLGLLLLVCVKELVKLVVRSGLVLLCQLFSVPCVCRKRVSEVTFLKVHYSPHFTALDKAPVLASQQSFLWPAEQPLNLHMAVKLVTYSVMGLVLVWLAPHTFTLLGI